MKSLHSGVNRSDDSCESIYADTFEEPFNSGDDSESPVPEPLDSGVNMSDDSCESWICAESEFDNSSGDFIYADTCEEFLNGRDDSESPVPDSIIIGINF